MYYDEDFALALRLQEQLAREDVPGKPSCLDIPGTTPVRDKKASWNVGNKENYNSSREKISSIVDPSWEYIDPNPDIHAMFIQFNKRFFWRKLDAVEVRWSSRMTSCAGVCCYQGRAGMCSIRLSLPLLKLRPRKDLVETLLHEMIHAYLFVTHNNRDRDGHGPEFHKHMYRINKEAGTKITVYHSFHDEVKLYKQHWWRCGGPCQNRPPFFGMVKRAVNRAPGPNDLWWAEHQATCGGNFVKVHEPEGFSSKKSKGKQPPAPTKNTIRSYFPGKGSVVGKTSNGGFKTGQSGNLVTGNGSVGKMPNGGFTTGQSGNQLAGKGNVGKTSNSSFTTGQSGNRFPGKGSGGKLSKGSFTTGQSGNHTATKGSSQASNGSDSKAGDGSGFVGKGRGGFGGMLANKGGGTVVITAKGKNRINTETEMKGSVINDGKSSSSSLPSNFTPFSGKGHTLGAPTAPGDKPWLARLDKMQSIAAASPVCKPSGTMPYRNSHIISPDKRKAAKNDGEEPGKRTKATSNSSLDMWSSVPPSKSLSSPSCSQASENDDNMVTCPSCNVLINEQILNIHLDSCLQSAFNDDESVLEKGGDSRRAKCAICNNNVERSNLHSDVNLCELCLRISSNNNDGDNDGDCVMIPGEVETDKSSLNKSINCPMCNNELAECDLGSHLETCVASVLSDDVIVIEDDDDEPSDNGELAYPCPCCTNMVKESLMNHHLDGCLSDVNLETYPAS